MNCTCGNYVARATTGPDIFFTGVKTVMVCLNCGRHPPLTGREAQEISIAAEGYKAQRDALRQALEVVLAGVGEATAHAQRVLKEMER